MIMKPLISKIPLVGGLQVFFLNNPDIDFNLVGVADLLDMPGLSDMLRRIIVEQIGAIMVLPNKLPIVLSNEIPSIAVKMPEPEVTFSVIYEFQLHSIDFPIFAGCTENSCGRSKGLNEERHWSVGQRKVGSVRYHHGWSSTIPNAND